MYAYMCVYIYYDTLCMYILIVSIYCIISYEMSMGHNKLSDLYIYICIYIGHDYTYTVIMYSHAPKRLKAKSSSNHT